ncbi:MAG: protein kinase [Acidobacteriota bacterium]
MSVPQRFGRYEVIDVLGQGAMGLVYRASDPVIDRTVAVKVIQAHPAMDADKLATMEARFEQEFRAAGALSHPNIVTIYDVGRQDDLYYIAMEYVVGEDLDSILASRRILSFKEVADLLLEISAGLDYAHSRGVVHRDVKPANILITSEGHAKITDFGLAKAGTAATLTQTGMLIGTPAYMSPEQVTGHPLSGASDQFSVAIILYEMLTGELPFTGGSPSTIMYRIVHEDPIPPRKLNQSLPAPVDEVLTRALEKAPASRYPCCVDLANSLRSALGAAPAATMAVDVAPGAPAADPASKAPAVTLAAGTAGGSAVAAAGTEAGPAGSATRPPPSTMSRRRGGRFVALAVALPSLALVGVLAWLVASGRLGGGQLPLSQGRRDAGTIAGQPGDEANRTESAPVLPNKGGQEPQDEPAAAATVETPSPEELRALAAGIKELQEQLKSKAAQPPSGERQAEPAAQPPPVTPPERVEYEIISDPPGAQVRLDGRPIERVTPVKLELEPGQDHQLRLLLRGYEPADFTINLTQLGAEELRDQTIHFVLPPHVAATRPDRAGRADFDRATGRSPSSAADLVPPFLRGLANRKLIRLSHLHVFSSFPVAMRLSGRPTLSSNLPADMRERLRRAVFQNRESIAIRDHRFPASTVQDVELLPGSYRVTLISPEFFLQRTQSVELKPGEALRIEAPRVVTVRVDSGSGPARVSIDGHKAGTTPLGIDIVLGEHQFNFTWSHLGKELTLNARIHSDGQRVSASAPQ